MRERRRRVRERRPGVRERGHGVRGRRPGVRGRRRGARALAAAVALASGCASWPGALGPRLDPCPGPLASPEAIAGDFSARYGARISAASPAIDLALSLVVEKRGDRLRVVGFSALGAKRFAVTQRGEDVEVEYFGPPPAVPGENVLRDLHRVYASTPSDPAAGTSAARVVSDRSPQGQPRTRIENPACGYDATYVEQSRAARP